MFNSNAGIFDFFHIFSYTGYDIPPISANISFNKGIVKSRPFEVFINILIALSLSVGYFSTASLINFSTNTKLSLPFFSTCEYSVRIFLIFVPTGARLSSIPIPFFSRFLIFVSTLFNSFLRPFLNLASFFFANFSSGVSFFFRPFGSNAASLICFAVGGNPIRSS